MNKQIKDIYIQFLVNEHKFKKVIVEKVYCINIWKGNLWSDLDREELYGDKMIKKYLVKE